MYTFAQLCSRPSAGRVCYCQQIRFCTHVLGHRRALKLTPVILPRKDYYEILQIPRGADEQVIKRSYKKLALQNHPVSAFSDHLIMHVTSGLTNLQEASQFFMMWSGQGQRWQAGEGKGGKTLQRDQCRYCAHPCWLLHLSCPSGKVTVMRLPHDSTHSIADGMI